MRPKRHKAHTQPKKRDYYCESFTWWNSFLQFSKILCHILKSAWQNLRLTKGFTLHITGIKPLCWCYTPHEVSEQFVQLLVDRVDNAHTLQWVFFKCGFCFHFFLHHHNPFESHIPTRELARQKYWFYCGLLVQCTSTLKIAKNHLLVYKIAFVAKMPPWPYSIFSRSSPL